MSNKVVTFGEVMMRLSPPNYAKFSQASTLEIEYGGGEANVAIALAYMGLDTCHVTRLPDTMIGKSVTQYLRQHWLDTRHVIYGDARMGMYFLEKGAVHRSSKVVYERDGSSFSRIQPEMVNWEEILKGADWFHWTGITPALSQGACDTCLAAIKTANKLGVTVSGDIHSRKSLWQYGKTRQEVLPELISGTDVVIASSYDLFDILNIGNEKADFAVSAKAVQERYPKIKVVADKDREMISASHNRIQGKMWKEGNLITSPSYDVTHIIDRVGTGDAFGAGLIYGLLHHEDDEVALKYGAAACALKHTVEGDANMVSAEDVTHLVRGNYDGRIKR